MTGTAGSPLRVVIVGAGRFGTLHARVWAEAGAEVCGVVDTDTVRAEELAEATGARTHGDALDTVLTATHADVAVIASDEASHAELALCTLQSGAHAFIEKPFAMSSVDARRIIDTAEEWGLHAFAGHISRFAEPYRYLRSQIMQHRIGDLWSLRLRRDFSQSWFASFGGRVHPAWESCVHDVDLAIYLTGGLPTRIYARQSDAAGSAAPSVLSALVDFDTGQTATIESAWALPDSAPHNLAGALALDGTIAAECEVIGSTGMAKQRLVSDALAVWSQHGVITPDLSLWPEVDGRIAGALRTEIDAALAVFRGEHPNAVMPHHHALASVGLVEAMIRSLESGEPEDVHV